MVFCELSNSQSLENDCESRYIKVTHINKDYNIIQYQQLFYIILLIWANIFAKQLDSHNAHVVLINTYSIHPRKSFNGSQKTHLCHLDFAHIFSQNSKFTSIKKGSYTHCFLKMKLTFYAWFLLEILSVCTTHQTESMCFHISIIILNEGDTATKICKAGGLLKHDKYSGEFLI